LVLPSEDLLYAGVLLLPRLYEPELEFPSVEEFLLFSTPFTVSMVLLTDSVVLFGDALLYTSPLLKPSRPLVRVLVLL
jgi:hypothetical protein